MTVAGLFRKYSKIDIRQEAVDTMREQESEIVSLNRSQLYNHGFNADQEKLIEYASQKYARAKNLLNPGPGYGNPDLKLKGNFQRKFFLSVNRGRMEFEIDSKDIKSGKLKEKYGDNIFGLSTPSKEIYTRDYFIKRLIQRINEG